MIRICLILLLIAQVLWTSAEAAHTPAATGLEAEAEATLKARFEHAGVHYPPEHIQLIALKETRRLELWAWSNKKWHHVYDYPIFAASGHAGPKLREGDKQVPEGFYRIEALNPNSHFHLSLKLDYPNPYDWKHARDEGREKPGSDIFIHGSAWSIGCLAIGNRNVEELFGLVSRIGPEQVQVLIAPYDFRKRQYPQWVVGNRPWIGRLYGYLSSRMNQFPLVVKQKAAQLERLVQKNQLNIAN